jgi:competence protein ComEC
MKSALCLVVALFSFGSFASEKDGRLDVIWSDVEGGAATLIITPKGESVLIDAGNPGVRDPGRIQKAATDAGLKKIDHLITTHFHNDHFGGAAELSKLIPIGTVWDNGVPETNPDGNPNPSWPLQIKPYKEMSVEKREVIKPGTELPLKQLDGPRLSIRCLGAKQKFIDASNAKENECKDPKHKETDTSDNANSVVMLIEFGKFQLYVGGDLTWNLEEKLVCPKNLVGVVDVYQVTHHGLDRSNNPLVVNALQPTVSIMSNGTAKGCEAETFATLKATPSIKAMYQIHRNLRADSQNNTAPEFIANLEKECQAVPIKMTVAADASNYTISIPGKKESERTFQTK